VALALALLLSACCGQSEIALAALDAGYAATVQACLQAERAALAAAQTREAWKDERDRLRLVCDAAVAAWEGVRAAQGAPEADAAGEEEP
jgi:hypothetical protein